MRFELTGRHIKITPALRTIVESGLAHSLRKLNNSAVSAQLVLTKEKTRVVAEATLHAKGEHFLHAEAAGVDAKSAINAVLAKIDHQAQKLKSRWTKGKRQEVSTSKTASAAAKRAALVASAPGEAAGGELAVRIVRARRYEVKPMSVDEAAFEVSAARGSFLVFRDATTETINVLFRRPDGHLGLIEPERE